MQQATNTAPPRGRARSRYSVLAFVLTLVCSPAFAGGAADPGNGWVPGRILVQAKAGVSDANLQRILAGHSGRSVERIRGLRVHVVSVPPQAEDAVVRALSRNPNIKFAEKDHLVPLSETPDDPRFGDAWHHRMVESGVASYSP